MCLNCIFEDKKFFYLIQKSLSNFNIKKIRLISIIISESEKIFGFSKMDICLQEKNTING